MRCGLFGKHASRRDLIAIDVPATFLSAYEPWLQASVSASRERLGPNWQKAYLRAPIWRFWLGSDLCGTIVLGALMPSLDEIGRYYPLTVLAAAKSSAAIPPPEFETHESWFKAVESFLLATLTPGVSHARVAAGVAALPFPSTYSPSAARAPVVPLAMGGVLCPLDDHPLTRIFASLRHADWAGAYAGRAFFWTEGGVGFRPMAFATRTLPHPDLFAAMLNGDFRAFTA